MVNPDSDKSTDGGRPDDIRHLPPSKASFFESVHLEEEIEYYFTLCCGAESNGNSCQGWVYSGCSEDENNYRKKCTIIIKKDGGVLKVYKRGKGTNAALRVQKWEGVVGQSTDDLVQLFNREFMNIEEE